MPTRVEDYEKAASRAQELSAVGSQYEAASYSLAPQIMAAVREDRAKRGVSKLAEGTGVTLGQIPTQSAAVRGRAGDMVNPMEVDKITAAQRGQQLETLGTISSQAEYEQGTLTDILSEQTNMLKALAASKMAEAQQAADKATSLMDMLKYEEGVRQFNEELEFRKIQEANKGSGDSGFAGLVQAILEKDKEREPAPEGEEGVVNFDEDGEENYPETPQQPTFDVWNSIKEWVSSKFKKPDAKTGGGGSF